MKLLLAALLAALVLLSACAERDVIPSGSASTTPSTSPTFVPDPATREAVNPDPNFDYGFVVQITSQGFHPRWLVSACCLPVTWKNLTGQPASVVFDHQPVQSGLIPPGGTFMFKPRNVESITYHAGTNPAMTGALQVNQTTES